MRLTLFALPLLAALAAPAQTPQQSKAQAALASRILIATMNDCPVGLFAQRRDSGQTIWITSLEDAQNPHNQATARPGTTGVHVRLTAPAKSAIRQAEVEVYFVAPGTHALLVANTKSPADLKKTFHLSAPDGASFKLAGDLLIGPSAGITHVHLLHIDYADGTTWKAANNGVCSVEPNGFLLVGAH